MQKITQIQGRVKFQNNHRNNRKMICINLIVVWMMEQIGKFNIAERVHTEWNLITDISP